MLAEIENGLVALIEGSALAARLAKVDTLPDLDEEGMVKRLGAEAPGVYVVPGSFPVASGAAVPRFGFACVAKHARGHEAARKGDGKAIGLYQILDGVAALADNANAGGTSWRVVGVDFMADAKLYQAGLHVAVVRIEATAGVTLPAALDEAALADFLTLRADYDVPPHASANEHVKWAGDPADHSTSAPDVSETVTINP